MFRPHRPFATMAIFTTSAAVVALLAGCSSSANESTGTSPDPTVTPAQASTELHDMLPTEIQEAGVIEIGTPLNNAPMIFLNAAGEPTGAAFEVANALGAVLGVEVEFTELAFPGVIPGLQTTDFDLSMGVIGDTAERQQLLDFVDLMKNDSGLLVAKGNPEEVTDLTSLCGATVGTLAGALQIALVQDASATCEADGDDPITVNEYASGTDGQAQVASGRIAAYIAPFVSIAYTAKTAADGGTFEVTEARYPSNPWAIAMTKDRGTLADAVLGAMAEIVENGTYGDILAGYDVDDAALSSDQVLINGAGTAAFN